MHLRRQFSSIWGVLEDYFAQLGCRQHVQDVEVGERRCLLLNQRAQNCNDEQLCRMYSPRIVWKPKSAEFWAEKPTQLRTWKSSEWPL